jgi:hypothetical protein
MVLAVWTPTDGVNRQISSAYTYFPPFRTISAREMAIMAGRSQDVHTFTYSNSQCLIEGASIESA